MIGKKTACAVLLAMVAVVGFISFIDDSSDGTSTDVVIDGIHYASVSEALSANSTGTIVLKTDLSDSFTITETSDITIDLNGKTLTATSLIRVHGVLTVIDSTVNSTPVVDDMGAVTYESGKITCNGRIFDVDKGGSLIVNSGTLVGQSSAAYVWGNTTVPIVNGVIDAEPIESKVIVNGGYLKAEYWTIVPWGYGANVEINGGVIEATDGMAISGNGTNGVGKKNGGGTEITINDGVLISNETDLSCTIYNPQAGTLTINGGKLYSFGGIGILMRAGSLTINGGSIITTGEKVGTVGDSKSMVGCHGVTVDFFAGYPGEQGLLNVKINGGVIKSDVESVFGYDSTSGKYMDSVKITGGYFSSDVSSMIVDNVSQTFTNGMYCVGKTYAGEDVVSNTNNISVVDVNNSLAVSLEGVNGAPTKVSIASSSNMGSVQISVSQVDSSNHTDNCQFRVDLKVSNNTPGDMNITVSMIVPDGFKPVVNYIAENGNVESMEIVEYGSDYVTFRTNHNSVYEFGTVEHRVPIYDDDDEPYYPPTTVVDKTSEDDDKTTVIIACAAAAAAAALAMLFFLVDSRRP